MKDGNITMMTEANEVTYNIEASLMNVQRGDVMVIRFPENEGLSMQKREEIAKNIREMLVINNISIPVVFLPYKWDVLMVEKNKVDDLKEEENDSM